MVDRAATIEVVVARAADEPIAAAAAKQIVITGPAIGVAVDTIAIVVGRAEQNIFEGADFGVAVMVGDPIGIVEVHALIIGIGDRKTAESGKRVSARVVLGGSRTIKKNITHYPPQPTTPP